MTTSDTSSLDDEELLQLALREAGQNRSDKAIVLLKQLLEKSPEHGKAYYLLGALHAEIGLYERAIDEMQAAVKFDPDLPTAHFQLGLLFLSSGRLEDAESAWQPLDKLGESEPLFLFKRGLLQLGQDNLEACIDDLNLGISLNSVNPKLNLDMQRIIDSTRQLQSQASAEGSDSNEAAAGRKTLLSAYQRSDFDQEE